MISLDQILTNRVGFGRGQLEQFFIVGLIDFLDGFGVIFLAILLSILKNEWNLSNGQIMILGSIYFLGAMVGLLVQGYYSDYFGRKKMLIIGMLITTLSLIIHALIQNFIQAVILRFVFGLVFGITLPLSIVVISEQVPLVYRGRVVVSLQLVFLLGLFYLIFCCWVFLDNFEEGNWRVIFLLNSIPALICLISTCLWFDESARFDLIQERFSCGFITLDNQGIKNNQEYKSLNDSEKDGLIHWQIQMKSRQFSRNIADLLKHGMLRITLNLWGISFLWNLQCSGIWMIFPFILQQSSTGFAQTFFIFFWELPTTLIVILIIDSKRWGGRKRLFALGLILYIMAEFFIYSYREDAVVLGMIAIRVSDKLVWLCFNQIKIESYITYYRTLGTGVTEALGKFAAATSSFVVFFIFNIDPFLPFLVFGCMSLITVILVLIHPVDLTQQPLDDGLVLDAKCLKD